MQMADAKKYPAVEALFVSPMLRCRESAKILFSKQSFSVVSELRECDFGRYENKNFQELSGDADYQRWLDSNGTLPFPAGEEQSHFRKRCVEAFKVIVTELFEEKKQSAAIVVHGGTIMSIMERYAVKEDGTPAGSYYDYQIKNGEGYELRISENDIYDDRDRGGLCSGSDLRGSKMAVSSGEADRASDIGNRKNYQKLSAGE